MKAILKFIFASTILASQGTQAQEIFQYTYCMSNTFVNGVHHFIFSAPFLELPEMLPGEDENQARARTHRLHEQGAIEFRDYLDRTTGRKHSYNSVDCRQIGAFQPSSSSRREQAIEYAMLRMKNVAKDNGKPEILTDFVPSWARHGAILASQGESPSPTETATQEAKKQRDARIEIEKRRFGAGREREIRELIDLREQVEKSQPKMCKTNSTKDTIDFDSLQGAGLLLTRERAEQIYAGMRAKASANCKLGPLTCDKGPGGAGWTSCTAIEECSAVEYPCPKNAQ